MPSSDTKDVNFLIINENRSGTKDDLKIELSSPTLSFKNLQKIKNFVLGKKYDLSLIFAPDTKLAALNKKYRGKKNTTDILSFPLSDQSGEIYISPRESARQARLFNFSNSETAKFIGFLFIHGLLHLKGYDHGSRMEQEETRLVKKFRLPPSLAPQNIASSPKQVPKKTNKWQKKSRSASTLVHIKSKRS